MAGLKYRLKGFDKKEVKKNAMKPIPLMNINVDNASGNDYTVINGVICDSKKSKPKTTQPKI